MTTVVKATWHHSLGFSLQQQQEQQQGVNVIRRTSAETDGRLTVAMPGPLTVQPVLTSTDQSCGGGGRVNWPARDCDASSRTDYVCAHCSVSAAVRQGQARPTVCPQHLHFTPATLSASGGAAAPTPTLGCIMHATVCMSVFAVFPVNKYKEIRTKLTCM